jgi:hypothetical protein
LRSVLALLDRWSSGSGLRAAVNAATPTMATGGQPG